MRKSVVFLFALFLGLSLAFPSFALALKTRVQRGGTTGGATKRVISQSLGVTSSIRFRADRQAIIMALSDLSKASQISYTLTYTGSGVPQGVSGTIKPSGESSVSRELVFGTCSAGVCRYHTGIYNARLVITTYLKSGLHQKVHKPYRIKV